MAGASKSESPPVNIDEEKLAHALISKGMVTREQVQQCRTPSGSKGGTETLLARLVEAKYITPEQSRRFSQDMAVLIGQQIPGYQLLEKIGQGSMGIVYKARQVSMNRLVAIKVLQARLATNKKELDRFMHEAHLAAKLSHNNIVQAIDVGTANKIHYFIMEYMEGTTIDHEIKSGKVYEEHEALDIILQIAHALEHAHLRQLVHRDIKPANIMITNEGVAKLADLGLARQTANDKMAEDDKGMVCGTPYYIAPEQIQGLEDIDVRADIYSLGATFYHMVTGKPPFPGKKIDAILDAHLHQELTPPDHLNLKLSAGLGEVIEFMMAKDRRHRYPKPEELISDLECVLAGQPPKLARQRIKSGMLQDLASGEIEEEEDDDRHQVVNGIQPIWVIVLGVALAISMLLNLILLLKRS